MDFNRFPRLRWRTAPVEALARLGDSRLSYGPHAGAPELRSALAAYLARARALVLDANRVIISCGISHGLSALCRALRSHGTLRVGIEDPGWRWQRFAVERAGLEPIPVPVDAAGLVVEQLASSKAEAVILTPAHQYPTGVLMSPERRTSVIAWARERRALIVEDDYCAQYQYGGDPIGSLQGLAPDCVAYVGTISNLLAPALRLGWIVVPTELSGAVRSDLYRSGVTPATLDQVALASLITNGSLDRHLRIMRPQYGGKRDHMIAELGRHLPDVRIGGAPSGLHLTAWLPAGSDERLTARRAREAGVGTHGLRSHCSTYADWPPALLLGFALPTQREISEGIRRLATLRD